MVLRSIHTDEDGIISTICVGMFDFFKQRILENEAFLEKARSNMLRMEMVLGRELVDQVNVTNVQNMLMRFLVKNRIKQDISTRKQVEVYRKLIESIPPTRTLIEQRENENVELVRKIEERSEAGGGVIAIREQMSARTVMSVDGVEGELAPVEHGVEVRSDGQSNLIVKPNVATEEE